MTALRSRPKTSYNWRRFAEEVVARAGVVDEQTQELLLKAFGSVPRDRFIEAAFSLRAAQDVALPIGYGQTISRPSSVARMLGLIGLTRGMRVLEVGCGSGYVSAVMAAAGCKVYAVEYIGLLAQKTRHRLDSMGYQNILIRRGDGRRGWSEHAPYDAIIVSAAFETISPTLFEQLSPGGRLVAPIGAGPAQILSLWENKPHGLVHYSLEPCSFVDGYQFS